MTPGQSRVLIMLLILLGLEALRMPGIKTFFHNAYTQFATGLSQASGGTSPAPATTTPPASTGAAKP